MSPPRFRLYAAFAAVWILWGSTYLAIRFALEALPPFTMAAARFLISGSVLYVWAAAQKTPRPKLVEWRSAFIIGGMLLFVGNGGVVLAEQRVASSIAALLVSGTPMWITLFEWITSGQRPRTGTAVGLLVGIVGVAILVSPAELGTLETAVDPIGALMLLTASLSWAGGSLYARRAPLPSSQLQATGMQMLAGGILLLSAGLVRGEIFELKPSAITGSSLLALSYLIVAGSLLGFTSYAWLLKNTTPARATTYAYVNPVVAVILGWAIAGEPITPRMLIAGAVIVGALVLITRTKTAR